MWELISFNFKRYLKDFYVNYFSPKKDISLKQSELHTKSCGY
jgi:hypothetical protein